MSREDANLRALGAYIREHRNRLNLTQSQLAERLGWSQERISILESGKYGTPSLPSLVQLAESLEIPVLNIVEMLGYPMTGGVLDRAASGVPAGNIVLLYTLQRLLAINAITLNDALNQASDQMAVAMGADKVDAFTYNAPTNSLVALGTSNTPMGRRQKQSGLDHVALANRERTAEVYQTGEVFYTGNAQSDPKISVGVKETLGVQSLLAVPLRINGEIQGVVVAESAHEDRFSPEEQRFFVAATQWVGMIAHRAEMIESMRQVEAAEARRVAADEVITALAHDLGNYLTPLKGRLDLLTRRLRQQNNARELEQADEASHAVIGIQQLVNRLLDIARLDQGLFTLVRQPVDLCHLAEEVVGEVQPSWPALHLSLTDVPAIDGDPVRLREVVVNLLTNAVQHSPDGAPITLGLGCERREDGEWVVMNVTDEGPGITPDLVPHLFDRFGGVREASRMGLGLYLSHRLVEAHGGTLTVETAVGHGTTFWMALPASAH